MKLPDQIYKTLTLNITEFYVFFKTSLSMHIMPLLFAMAFVFIAEKNLKPLSAKKELQTQIIPAAGEPAISNNASLATAKSSTTFTTKRRPVSVSEVRDLFIIARTSSVNPFSFWSFVNVANISQVITVDKFSRILTRVTR